MSIFAGAALCALAACAGVETNGAAQATAQDWNAKPQGYLSADALHGADILPPPPAPDSPRGLADRAAYDETRALKDTPRWATAIQDSDLWKGGAVHRYSCAVGVELGEKTTPAVMRIFRKIEFDGRTVGTPPKDHYDRPRPLIGNDKPLCVPRADWMKTNASYPSGHSLVEWSWALVLAELVPAKADAALKLGQDMGWSRVVCGVHYPSDVEAGRTLGAGMVARLHADPAFAKDMAEARAELARPQPAPTGCS
ncbi:phosphatase PAP2 family protein [Phenylobacterium sp.]|uniref:acid phosphatase n=1 Tax=Phenylobacterium sp. TaxID=1871053 RepID=UPI0035B04FB9